jgi:hypothetical protein
LHISILRRYVTLRYVTLSLSVYVPFALGSLCLICRRCWLPLGKKDREWPAEFIVVSIGRPRVVVVVFACIPVLSFFFSGFWAMLLAWGRSEETKEDPYRKHTYTLYGRVKVFPFSLLSRLEWLDWTVLTPTVLKVFSFLPFSLLPFSTLPTYLPTYLSLRWVVFVFVIVLPVCVCVCVCVCYRTGRDGIWAVRENEIHFHFIAFRVVPHPFVPSYRTTVPIDDSWLMSYSTYILYRFAFRISHFISSIPFLPTCLSLRLRTVSPRFRSV